MTIHSHSNWTYDDSFEAAVDEVVYIVQANSRPGKWRPPAFVILSVIDGFALVVASILDAGKNVPEDYIKNVSSHAPDPWEAEQVIRTALTILQEQDASTLSDARTNVTEGSE